MADFDLGRARGTIEIDSTDLDNLKSKASDASKSFSSSMKSIGSSMTSAGKSMTLGLTLPIIGFGVAAVKSFTESQTVITQTQSVIKSTGGAANVTSKSVGRLASRIQEYSGQSDEAVRAGENMLLTFTNVQNQAGKGNDIFNQSTKILADMSQVFGKDMSDSAIQLGKALNDPIKGVSALSRVGVAFTEQQKKQITGLVEGGKTMEAQKIILAELTKEFGGSAKAFGTTAAGQFAIGKQKIDDAMESIGKSIIKVAGPIMEKLASAIEAVMGWFNKLSPGMKTAVIIFGAIIAAVGPLLVILGTLASAVGSIAALFAAGGVLAGVALWPIAVAAAFVILAVVIYKNWGSIKAFLLKTWETIKAAGIAVWDAIKNAAMAVFNFLRPIIMAFVTIWKIEIAILLGVWKVIWTTIKIIVTVVLAIIIVDIKIFLAIFKAAFNALAPVAKAVFGAIMSVAKTLFHIIAAELKILAAVFKAVFGAIKAVAIPVWHAIQTAARVAFSGIKAAFNVVKDGIIGGWHAIENVGRPIWNAIVGAAKIALGGLVSLWNATVGAISHGQTIGVGPLHATMPDLRIEGFAKGVKDFVGGLALVGEKGPEVVYLPKHSSVLPNNQIRRAQPSGQIGGGQVSLKGLSVTIVDSNLGVVMRGVVTDESDEQSQFRDGMKRMSR